MQKKIKYLIFILIVIAFAIYFIYYSKKKEVELIENTGEKISQREIIINKLVERYDASTDWNENMDYTIQLQNSLIESDKYILFTGAVDDIFFKNGEKYIRFLSSDQIYFILKCDLDIITEITNRERKQFLWWWNEDYAVVAKIEGVRKPILKIAGYSEYEEEDIELEYNPSEVFIATGNCSEVIYLGSDLEF